MSSEILVRKRRGDAGSADEGNEEAKKWLRDLLSERGESRRVISPTTEKKVKELLERWEAKPEGSDITDMHELAGEIKRRIILDEKFASARQKLEELIVTEFRLRYGDYLAAYMNDVRKEAKGLQRKGKPISDESGSAPGSADREALKFFMGQRWSAIHQRLLDENIHNTWAEMPNAPNATGAPLVRLLQVLAVQMGQSTLDLTQAISTYAKRNSVAHSKLQELAGLKAPYPLASTLERDLQDLADAPRMCVADVPAIRTAIFSVAHKYFKEFRWDDERRVVTLCVPKDDFFCEGGPTGDS